MTARSGPRRWGGGGRRHTSVAHPPDPQRRRSALRPLKGLRHGHLRVEPRVTHPALPRASLRPTAKRRTPPDRICPDLGRRVTVPVRNVCRNPRPGSTRQPSRVFIDYTAVIDCNAVRQPFLGPLSPCAVCVTIGRPCPSGRVSRCPQSAPGGVAVRTAARCACSE